MDNVCQLKKVERIHYMSLVVVVVVIIVVRVVVVVVVVVVVIVGPLEKKKISLEKD